MAERRAGCSRKHAQPALRSAAIPSQARRDALPQCPGTLSTLQGTALAAQAAGSKEPSLCPAAHLPPGKAQQGFDS